MNVAVREFDLGRVLMVSTRLDGDVADEELARSLADYREMLIACQSKHVRVVSFVDLRGVGNMTAKQRRRQGEWYREMEPLTRAVTLGLGYIAPSAVTRGLLTAVFWVSPPVVPFLVSATMLEALTWAYGLCETHGVEVSSATRAQCTKCFD